MENLVTAPRVIIILCSLWLGGCAGNGVTFDPDKPHHGDGEFLSVKQGSFFGHFRMRQQEPDPPPPDPDEAASIVTEADLEDFDDPVAGQSQTLADFPYGSLAFF